MKAEKQCHNIRIQILAFDMRFSGGRYTTPRERPRAKRGNVLVFLGSTFHFKGT